MIQIQMTDAAHAAFEAVQTAFEAAECKGSSGISLPDDATPLERQAWKLGQTKARAASGAVWLYVASGSRCRHCKAVNYGFRGGCQCWPDGGWDDAKNKAGGYRMQYGGLVSGKGNTANFMTVPEMKKAIKNGKPIVDSLTGEPVVMPHGREFRLTASPTSKRKAI